MLGWEFPPFLTGGLGKASYGLAKALSQHADLTLIIPKSDKSYFKENWRIIGLHELESEHTELGSLIIPEKKTEIKYLDADLDPYSVEDLLKKYPKQALEAFFNSLLPSLISIPTLSSQQNTNQPQASFISTDAPVELESAPQPTVFESHIPTFTPEQANKLYSEPEIYGSNLLTKIAAYTETVRELSKEIPFDVIHAHDWMTFPAALQIKQETDKPVVLHIHSLETDRQGAETIIPEENLAYRIERTAIEHADAVIAVSEYTQEQLEEHYEIAPGIVTPIHNAIEPIEPISKSGPKINLAKGIKDKLVVWVGRVTHQKGPTFLLDTADRLTKVDKNVKFVIAGTGDLLPWLIEESARRKLSSHFLFTGFLNQEKVTALLSQADVFFMPSESEPFGMAALEAAQLGVPCVISSQSGVAEVLRSSLKADYWDTAKLANYLYALLHYEGLRKELIAQSQTELVSLTWEQSAKKVLDVYEKIMQND
jgi:glycogen(starch) synthase